MKEMTLVNGFVNLINWFTKFTILPFKAVGDVCAFNYGNYAEPTSVPSEVCSERSHYIPNLRAHTELLPKLAGSQTGFLFENDADILRLKPCPLRNL